MTSQSSSPKTARILFYSPSLFVLVFWFFVFFYYFCWNSVFLWMNNFSHTARAAQRMMRSVHRSHTLWVGCLASSMWIVRSRLGYLSVGPIEKIPPAAAANSRFGAWENTGLRPALEWTHRIAPRINAVYAAGRRSGSGIALSRRHTHTYM